jgi:hypothetical protein
LEFGEAFVMTIYFVPLLVALRAYSAPSSSDGNDFFGCARFPSLSRGLSDLDELSVWGAKGPPDALSYAVQERLRDASARATHVLRKCFESADKEGASDFEVEIREATALLEFIQLSRTTFIPDWQDDDL